MTRIRWVHELGAGLLFLIGTAGAEAQPVPAPVPTPGPSPTAAVPREAFQASAFMGLGIDTFAAKELRLYLNPNDSGGVEERFVAGIDFEYRLVGNGDLDGQKLWVFGETVHGLRSAEVDCKAAPTLEVCKPFLEQIANPGAPALYILRNATSLEAFAGLRWEFGTIQRGSNDKPGPDAAKCTSSPRPAFYQWLGVEAMCSTRITSGSASSPSGDASRGVTSRSATAGATCS